MKSRLIFEIAESEKFRYFTSKKANFFIPLFGPGTVIEILFKKDDVRLAFLFGSKNVSTLTSVMP